MLLTNTYKYDIIKIIKNLSHYPKNIMAAINFTTILAIILFALAALG